MQLQVTACKPALISVWHTSVGLLTSEVPQILINKEALPHLNFDVELLGYCDDIVRELTHRLKPDWEEGGGGAGSRPHPSSEQGEHTCLRYVPAVDVCMHVWLAVLLSMPSQCLF